MWLITGSMGQVGTELSRLMGEKAICVDRDELDIADEEAVKRFLEVHPVEGIINCAAYTAVDRAEDEPDEANRANHLGPKWLARYGRKIIHISTDYVFDGTSHIPYREDDATNPLSVYGKTKLDGERAVFEEAETALVLRTAWVYSAHGSNFVKTMLRLGKERKSLTVVSDQIGSPTSAADLASAIVALLPRIQDGKKDIIHVTNEGVCSWYDFATEIMGAAKLDCQVRPIDSSQYPTKAARPFYSVISKRHLREDYGVAMRHWRQALLDVITSLKDKA